jgi:hypothetical protein
MHVLEVTGLILCAERLSPNTVQHSEAEHQLGMNLEIIKLPRNSQACYRGERITEISILAL